MKTLQIACVFGYLWGIFHKRAS